MKNFCHKKFWSANTFCWRKFLVRKNFWSAKFLISKKIFVSKYFYALFCLVGLIKLHNKFQLPTTFPLSKSFGRVLVVDVVTGQKKSTLFKVRLWLGWSLTKKTHIEYRRTLRRTLSSGWGYRSQIFFSLCLTPSLFF